MTLTDTSTLGQSGPGSNDTLLRYPEQNPNQRMKIIVDVIAERELFGNLGNVI